MNRTAIGKSALSWLWGTEEIFERKIKKKRTWPPTSVIEITWTGV